MGDPDADPCNCRPGYKCPYCEQEEKRSAKRKAEQRRVERLLSDGNGGDD